MSFQTHELFPTIETEAPGLQVKFLCLVQTSASVCPEERLRYTELPLLFSTVQVDLIKISPPSLNLVLPVFLEHHGSSTASKPSPKGSDRHSQLQHHLHIHRHSLLQCRGHLPPCSALISDLMFQLQIKPANAANPQSSGLLHRGYTPPSFLQWHTSSLAA